MERLRTVLNFLVGRPVLLIALLLLGSAGLVKGISKLAPTEALLVPVAVQTEPAPAPTTAPIKASSKALHRLSIPAEQAILINGPIGLGAELIIAEILQKAQAKKPLYVVLTSPGGSVLDGAMIISAMESAGVEINTVCVEICASMAAMIFEYGTNRYIVNRSFLMFHPASIGGVDREELDKTISRLGTLQRYIGKIEKHVADRASITFEKYKQLSSSELWLDGEDAVSLGYADVLITLPVIGQSSTQNLGSSSIFNLRKLNVHW